MQTRATRRKAGSLARSLWASGLGLGIMAATAGTAAAQGVCDGGRQIFQERAAIIQQINGWSKKQVDPNVACTTFTKLSANTTAALKFMTENGSWCRIPPDAIAAMETQQKQVTASRAKACQVAAQFNKAKKQAEQAAQSGGNNAFAQPDDLSGGPRPVPRGAL